MHIWSSEVLFLDIVVGCEWIDSYSTTSHRGPPNLRLFCTSLSTSLPLFLPASFSLSLCLSPSQHIYLSVCLSLYLNLQISLILSHISSGNLIGQNSILLTWVISETNQPCQVHIGSNSKGVWEHSEASGALTGLPWLVPAQGQVYPQRRRDRVRLNSKPTCILPDLPGACLATSNK